MFITGLGTATPPGRYTQRDWWEVFRRSGLGHQPTLRSCAIVKKVLTGDNGIAFRHLALDPLDRAFELTPDALHARFARHAPFLATQAAQQGLADSETRPEQVDAVLISTHTAALRQSVSRRDGTTARCVWPVATPVSPSTRATCALDRRRAALSEPLGAKPA